MIGLFVLHTHRNRIQEFLGYLLPNKPADYKMLMYNIRPHLGFLIFSVSTKYRRTLSIPKGLQHVNELRESMRDSSKLNSNRLHRSAK
jgi:hypothetical protein